MIRTRHTTRTPKKVIPLNKLRDKAHRFVIGIDPGVKTGVALYDRKKRRLLSVGSHAIHEAMDTILLCNDTVIDGLFVRFEDARKRNWFGNSGREKLQGAGSVKRDCKIWEDFLKAKDIPFEMVAPKNNSTKLKAESFAKITGYEGSTNEHGRDAGMLCWHI